MKRFLIFLAVVIVLTAIVVRMGYIKLPQFSKNPQQPLFVQQTVVTQESAVIKAVKDTLPSVVTVIIAKTPQAQTNPFDLFNQVPQQETIPKKVEQSIGSGFIIDKSGIIVTNKHVVSDTEADYVVMLNDGTKYNAERIVRDPLNDLAIIRISAKKPLTALPLGDSSKLQLGQTAIAIGTPLGEFPNTVTVGVISGIGRGITAGSPYEGFVERLDNVIQTDAAINPGNSGGPLITSAGQAIGVNTAVSQQSQNIGFAIPINVVKDLLDNYDKQTNTILRPFLGVRYQLIDKETALLNKMPAGAYVLEVVEGSSADKAGIKQKDMITEVNGKSVTSTDDIANLVKTLKVGDVLKIKLWRDGEFKNLDVKLGTYQ